MYIGKLTAAAAETTPGAAKRRAKGQGGGENELKLKLHDGVLGM